MRIDSLTVFVALVAGLANSSICRADNPVEVKRGRSYRVGNVLVQPESVSARGRECSIAVSQLAGLPKKLQEEFDRRYRSKREEAIKECREQSGDSSRQTHESYNVVGDILIVSSGEEFYSDDAAHPSSDDGEELFAIKTDEKLSLESVLTPDGLKRVECLFNVLDGEKPDHKQFLSLSLAPVGGDSKAWRWQIGHGRTCYACVESERSWRPSSREAELIFKPEVLRLIDLSKIPSEREEADSPESKEAHRRMDACLGAKAAAGSSKPRAGAPL